MSHLMRWCAAALCLASLCVHAESTPQVRVLASGLLSCAAADAVACELSAVAVTKNTDGKTVVYAANDKTPPAPASALLELRATGDYQWEFSRAVSLPPALVGEKYEAMTTLDNGDVLLSSAFHRAQIPAANQVLVLPRTGEPYRLGAASEGIDLRAEILRVLQQHFGHPIDFFKIEGLAHSRQQLWFGVREVAWNKQHYYTAILLAVPLQQRAGQWQYQREVKLLANLSTVMQTITGEAIGLSSIEVVNQHLYLLTSYEHEADPPHSYLWSMPIDRTSGLPLVTDLQPVREQQSNRPIVLPHKAEGLAALDANTLLIVHDDDRQLTGVRGMDDPQRRTPFQSPYTVLQVIFH